MPVEITEMIDFEAERLDGVLAGANGVPFLVVKAIDGMSDSLAPDDDSGTPGSPEWEAADAENLRSAAAALAAVRDKITAAADREVDEVEAGALDSYSDVFDLQDALYALDAALGIVARMSFTEAQESEAVAKALDSIRNTVSRVGDALNSPTPSTENDMTPEEITAIAAKAATDAVLGLAELAEADAVAKAAAADEAAAAAETEPAADASSDELADGAVAKSDVEDPAPVAEPAAEVAKADEAEAPAAATEAPVAKAEADPAVPTAEVFKSVVAEVLMEMFGDPLNDLKERLDTVEKSARPGGPLLNGASGTVVARDPQAAVADAEQVRKSIAEDPDPASRAVRAREHGISLLTAVYGGGVRPIPADPTV